MYSYYSIPLCYIPSYELCPRQESNLHFSLRRAVSYPLNDKGVI